MMTHIEGAGMLFRLMYPNGNIVVSRGYDTRNGWEGEYWLEIALWKQCYFMHHVNMNTPPTNLFTIYNEPLDSAESKMILHQLNVMRHIEDLPPFLLIRHWICYPKSCQRVFGWYLVEEFGRRLYKEYRLLVGEPRQFICDADGITACLDQWTWQMESRLYPESEPCTCWIDMQVSTDGIIAVLNWRAKIQCGFSYSFFCKPPQVYNQPEPDIRYRIVDGYYYKDMLSVEDWSKSFFSKKFVDLGLKKQLKT